MTKNSAEKACGGAGVSAAWRELDEFIAGQDKNRNALIPVLHQARRNFSATCPWTSSSVWQPAWACPSARCWAW